MAFSAIAVGAAVVGGATAIIGGNAARDAARTQANATREATAAQTAIYQQNRQDLSPYVSLGNAGADRMRELLDSGALDSRGLAYTPYREFTGVNADNVAQTPGYQFVRNEGLRAVTNTNTASGLAGSGAQAAGAASYATGLAENTYNSQVQNNLAEYMAGLEGHVRNFETGFNADQTGLTNMYNRIMGVTQVGQGAVATQANAGTILSGQIGQNLTGAANANAAGTIGVANAYAGGLNTAYSGVSNALIMNQLLNRYGSRPGGSGPVPMAPQPGSNTQQQAR